MRPKLICHMVSSIDGRLLVDRWTQPAKGIDSNRLRAHYDEIAARFDVDGWLVGRKTMAYYANGAIRQAPASFPIGLRQIHIGERKDRDLAIVFDPHGRLHYGRDDAGGDHVVAVLSDQVPDSYLAELREDGVSYLFAGTDGYDLHRAMDTLGEKFGTKTLLLEGGGTINGAFLKAGLIDEISLLISPTIDGLAGVPSIFNYQGKPNEHPAADQALRHISTETLEGGMVWLRYAVEQLG